MRCAQFSLSRNFSGHLCSADLFLVTIFLERFCVTLFSLSIHSQHADLSGKSLHSSFFGTGGVENKFKVQKFCTSMKWLKAVTIIFPIHLNDTSGSCRGFAFLLCITQYIFTEYIYLHNAYLHHTYLHDTYLRNIYLHNAYLHNLYTAAIQSGDS